MNHQEETGLPLDGNAAAGLLRELFALDVTRWSEQTTRAAHVEPGPDREWTNRMTTLSQLGQRNIAPMTPP